MIRIVLEFTDEYWPISELSRAIEMVLDQRGYGPDIRMTTERIEDCSRVVSEYREAP